MSEPLLIHCRSDRITLLAGEARLAWDGAWPGPDPEEAREVLRDVLDQLGDPGQTAVLCLDASWWFTAAIRCDGLPRRQRREGMRYRLEEQLPMDIEELTVEFLTTGGQNALGIALRTDRVRPLLDLCQTCGLTVERILPAPLLLAQAVTARGTTNGWLLLPPEGANADWIHLREGAVDHWMTAAYESTALRAALAAHVHLTGEPSVSEITFIGLHSDAIRKEFDEGMAVPKDPAPEKLLVEAVGADRPAFGVNLAREALAPARPLERVLPRLWIAVIALVAGVMLLAGGLYYRIEVYQALSEKARAATAGQYRTLHPNRPVPPRVWQVLEARARQYQLSGQRTVDLPPNALNSLRTAIAALPADVPLRLEEIQIDESGVFLRGLVRQHSHAELLAGALRLAGFVVDASPSNRRGRGGVTFAIQARHGDPALARQEGTP